MNEARRYSVLIVSEDDELSETLTSLEAFKTISGFEIKKILHDGKSAYEELKKENYDLIIAPPSLIAGFRVSDAASQTEGDVEAHHTEKISELFLSRSGELEEYLLTVKNEISMQIMDAANAERLLCSIYSSATNKVFSDNEWLELYLSQEDYEGQGSAYLKERLLALAKDYGSLFPAVHSEKIEEVILYILNNPESDLRQKTIASKMYVNSSYLSTVFAAQTGERFVDYLTAVKLKRAAYLLMKTTMKVSEIASRLDYKDIGYFSRLFKKQYGIPPSEYRIPDSYTYEI